MIRLIIILLLFAHTVFASVTLNNDTTLYDDFTVKYLYDKTQALNIDDVEKAHFSNATPNSFTFGYLEGVTWFKIEVNNLSDTQEYVLSFNEVIWKQFDFYHKVDGVWVEELNGLDVPLVQRSIQDVNPAFYLNIKKNSTEVFYVKAQTIASQLGMFEIYAHDRYFNPTRINIMNVYISFAFILFGIILINIHSLILTRDIVYVYYLSYIFFSIAFSAMNSGSYLILGIEGWSEGLHIVGALLSLSLLLFSDKFLELKTRMPNIHKYFMCSIWIFLLFIILLYFNVKYSNLAFNIYAIGFFGTLFFAVVKTYLSGYINVKCYLIALLIYVPLVGLMIAVFNTLVDYSMFARHAFIGGAFIEIVLFTLILTTRYSTANLEKIRIQEELIYEKNKNEEYLEEEISKRTWELQLLASTDPLTQLYNRRHFTEIADSILDISKRNKTDLSIMMLDIDDFKHINDSCGHALGDKVIVMVARIMQECSRKSDVVCRWGGEEFIILFPQTDMEGARVIAEKIRVKIENQVILLGTDKELTFTVSTGVSRVDVEKDNNLEYSINRADNALYKAKEMGKNRVVIEYLE